MALLLWTVLLAVMLTSASAFTITSKHSRSNTDLLAAAAPNNLEKFVASAILVSTLTIGIITPALADEYGVETEAPTLFTGESVMVRIICGIVV